MKALLDTNIIIDIALQRMPFFTDCVKIMECINDGKLKAYVSATTVTDIFYILKKENGREKTLLFLQKLLQVIDVAGIDKTIILKAIYSDWNDFEDAVQAQTAIKYDIDLIITRNTKDYKNLTDIIVIEPQNLMTYFPEINN
ncbi:MAG: PIN domain-containing protein [Prevotellaceae bacterium]|jgi:predicted nucleic acid-binding protein|nr:PIN domain-containing protein [Prevotellaceae bacterium]